MLSASADHAHESGSASAPRRVRDPSAATGSGDPAPLRATLLRHPLERDDQHLRVDLLERMRALDPGASLDDLALERGDAAATALGEFRARHGAAPAQRDRGAADAVMLKSLVATSLLHQSGAIAHAMVAGGEREELSDHEHALIGAMNGAYGRQQELHDAYGLDAHEGRSLVAYSFPHKTRPELEPGRENPYYMGAHARWGHHGTGWQALESAMAKVPSLGDLGVEMTTYRAPRNRTVAPEAPGPAEMTQIAPMAVGTNVVHGDTVMAQGQRHFLSTAITYNPHWSRGTEPAVGGIVGITGRSGRYMNPLGGQTYVDGGEVLYPPGVVSEYEGMNAQGFQGRDGTVVPVAHFRELARREPQEAQVDDFAYVHHAQRHPQLDAMKLNRIRLLERDKDPESVQRAVARRSRRGVMYLTATELAEVHQEAADRAPEPEPERGVGVQTGLRRRRVGVERE